MEDKFEYTPSGIEQALTYLKDTGDLLFVTEPDGSINNENAVAYANICYAKINKQYSTPLTYKEMYGVDEDIPNSVDEKEPTEHKPFRSLRHE